MTWYADLPAVRTRQIAKDATVAAWVWFWVVLGRGLYRAIERVRVVGDRTEAAGADLAGRMDGVADVIDGVPLVGGELQRPFTGAADAARVLQDAGATGSTTVHTVALWAGCLVALVPIAWMLARYVPSRRRWVREATAARALAGSLDDPGVIDLLAFRACIRLPLHVLAPLAGDRHSLAALELRHLGVAPNHADAATTVRADGY